MGLIEKELPTSWKQELQEVTDSPTIKNLENFLQQELAAGKVIYPPAQDIFNAFKLTNFLDVKVVILGQDPYHGPDQAHGLSFSVRPGIALPPSLKNIFKELKNDLNIDAPENGHLAGWARQGVFLLNTVLTVEKNKAGSHQKRGWEFFTDHVIQRLGQSRKNIVFILWGAPAQKKTSLINKNQHLIIKSPHPSPLSAYRGFFSSSPFSKANAYLKKIGQKEIDWSHT